MNTRLFTPKNAYYKNACAYIDLYIEIYVKRSLERLLDGEEPLIIYKFLDLATAKVCSEIYIEEISSYYNQKDRVQYHEIKELFLALGYLIHGEVEKNDLLMNSLTKANSNISTDTYNQLISEKVCEFITENTLPRLKQHPDFSPANNPRYL